MTFEELKSNLSFLLDDNVPKSLSMYFVLKSGDVRFANLEISVRIKLQEKLTKYLFERLDSGQDQINYCNLTEHANTPKTVCYYDLNEPLQGLEPLSTIPINEEQPEFSFRVDDFSTIKALVFLIGNESQKISLYKKQAPVNIVKRKSSLNIINISNELVEVKSDILKIGDTFSFLQINEKVFVFDTNALENDFGYNEILIRAAKTKIEIINQTNFIENIRDLEEFASEKKYAKKIVSIKEDNPVLSIPFDRLKLFINSHPKLRKRIKYNSSEDKIQLNTKVSKELFIKLLSDSFLKSELTELLYESSDKQQLVLEDND